ncbi:MAG TPA: nuclear transport factor 2 family protein [Acidimicrobiia bacterium]|nr:nuclear transport factor 2 family protein [Acidimicrobiia bacterium]
MAVDEKELRALLDERAIVQLMHRYAHAMDYGDEAAWVDVFTPDAVFDVVESVGGRRIHREEGRGDLARYVAAYPKPPAFRKHVIVDPVVEVDGDEGRVEAYWILLHREQADGAPVLAAFGRSRDRVVRRDGEWRIAERYAEVEATTFPSVAAGGEHE